MIGGVEQARLPRRPPLQRRWVVILKIVALLLLMFPFSTGGKRQLKFEPETRPLPSTLAPEGKRRGGGGGRSGLQAKSDEVLCSAVACMSRAARAMCRECAMCRGVCGV